MLIIVLVFIGLVSLILAHEAGHFFVAKAFGLKVDEFGFGFPPRIFAKKFGETEYSLNWLPFGGFVRIAGENDGVDKTDVAAATEEERKHIFSFQPAWKRACVMLAGVTVNFLIGWLMLAVVLMIGSPKVLVISEVQKGSPAEAIGLMAGDVVRDFTESQSFIDFTNAHRGQEVSLSITREGKEITFKVTPRVKTAAGEGAIGVALVPAGQERQGLLASLWDALRESVILVGFTFQAFYQLIAELFVHASLLPGVVGPVGIFSMAEETGKIGLIYLVQLVAIISLNLTVVNLIPFPALDGGRFFMIIIEKIKGSPISRRVEGWVNATGFAFLIVLIALLTIRDVGHLL